MSVKAASKVVKQLAGSGTGQSLMDRVTQAKYSLAGSGLGKAVAKATTEEIGAPKKKHLDYLINCSNEPNVSIPLLAGLLIERMQERSWVIVFKALITTHNLMNFGNEKFSQYLATNNSPLSLPNFNDKSSAQSYEMSLFIRMYSRYLSEKTASYRAMAFDFCKVKRGQSDGVLRTMPVDKLLKALPVLAEQVKVLLEFEVQQKDLNNAVINAAFLLLYKDLIRLFASYNEGMINLIEKYFTLKLSHCRIGLDLYHAFPDLQLKITEFMSVAESMGIGDRDSLGLQPVPEKVIRAMEQHMTILESKKSSDDETDEPAANTAPTKPRKPAVSVPIPKRPATKPGSPQKSPPLTAADEAPSVVDTGDEQAVESHHETELPGEDEGEPTEGCPKVVVDDADGLPSSVQEEIIAAATDHFSTTIAMSNEAVKRSASQTVIAAPQPGRSDQRTTTVKPTSSPTTRSRSPSPARPSKGPSTHLAEPRRERLGSVSDSELDECSSRRISPDVVQIKRNLSASGLNEANRLASACASPFAGDELDAGDAEVASHWPEHEQTPMETAANTHAPPTDPSKSVSAPSAIEDLLDLDWNSCSEPVGISPVTATPSESTTPQRAEANTQQAVGLDDLLSLDPLLNSEPIVSENSAAPTISKDVTGLPAGLKPVQSNVPIRPLAPAATQNKNALDSLDSTLVNLASSLGGQQSWGTSQSKGRAPLGAGKSTS